jgi:hypothetical protein
MEVIGSKIFDDLKVKMRKDQVLLEQLKFFAKEINKSVKEIENEKKNEKKKIDFINFTGSQNNKIEKIYKIGNLLKKKQFKNMKNIDQDLHLSSFIFSQKQNSPTSKVKTKWKPSLQKLKDHYKIGQDRLDRIKNARWNHNCPVSPVHGNTNKTPWNKTPPSKINEIKTFVEQNIMLENWPKSLNGKEEVQIVCCNIGLLEIYKSYKLKVEDPISFSSFCKYFPVACPTILLKHRETDCCKTCYEYNLQVHYKKDKSKIDEWKKHVGEALHRRIVYKQDRELSCKSTIYCISFDYKQSIGLPNFKYQPGPVYFTSDFNINVFNIAEEHSLYHNIFLYDETKGGKSLNEIGTCLFSFFECKKEHFGKDLIIYCDNCSGQNKNMLIN